MLYIGRGKVREGEGDVAVIYFDAELVVDAGLQLRGDQVDQGKDH